MMNRMVSSVFVNLNSGSGAIRDSKVAVGLP
jgi:hypothetical protein